MAAMGRYPVGIMIARGDLAVECGYERMAEVQEEILWNCEAAHLPVYLGDAGSAVAGEKRPAIASRNY